MPGTRRRTFASLGARLLFALAVLALVPFVVGLGLVLLRGRAS